MRRLTLSRTVADVVRVCFVCLGNICRSPAAEAVLRDLVDRVGLSGVVEVDSAGTSRYHIGDLPDRRARVEGERRGLRLDHRARQLVSDELPSWDVVVTMDEANQRDVERLAAALRTERAAIDVRLLRSFDASAVDAGTLEVPDPYYDGDAAFAHVFDVVEPACRALLAHLRESFGLTAGVDGLAADGLAVDGLAADGGRRR